MSDPLARAPSQVIGTQKVGAFVCGGPRSGFQMLDEPVYAPDHKGQGEAVRALRRSFYRGLREAALRAGLSAAELSAVELGRQHFTDWRAAVARLVELWGAP